MNRLLTAFLIAAVGLTGLGARDFKPSFSKGLELDRVGDQHYVGRFMNQIHRIGVTIDQDGNRSVVDTIAYYFAPEFPEDYDNFMAGYQSTGDDSIVTSYFLLAEGLVDEYHSLNETGGAVEVWVLGPSVRDLTEFGEEGLWWQFPGRPFIGPDNDGDGVGDYASTLTQLTPFGVPTAFTAAVPANEFPGGVWTPSWNITNFVDFFGGGIAVDAVTMGQDYLEVWVGYNGAATIFQDGAFHDTAIDGTCPSYSTLHSICAADCWYRIIASGSPHLYRNHLTQIVVTYEDPPPLMSDISVYSEAFVADQVISATVEELEAQAFVVRLLTSPSGDPGTFTVADSVEVAAGVGVFYGDVGTVHAEPGMTVYYALEAEDINGNVNVSRMYNYSQAVHPTMNQSLLVLNDNTGAFDTDTLYVDALTQLGVDFYWWNTSDRGGLDYSVVNWPGFNSILLFGWGGSALPATTGDDNFGFLDFIANGGNLMFADMDYLFANNLPATGTFVAGDFAHDVLGLGAYINDPDDDGDPTNGGSGEISMDGFVGNPISGEFTGGNQYGPINYDEIGWTNWGDYVTPAGDTDAELVFLGVSGVPSHGMGVMHSYPSGGNTVFFSFPIELAPQAEFASLLNDILEYLGTCVKGDVNADGAIDVLDIVRIVNIILEMGDPPTPGEACGADFNSDGEVDVLDIVGIVGVILGGSPRGMPAEEATVELLGNKLTLSADGAVSGIQLTVRGVTGDLIVVNHTGLELRSAQHGSEMTLLLYSLDGTVVRSGEILSFSEPVELGDITVANSRAGNVDVNLINAAEYQLAQNHPNPFNPTTTISYTLPRESKVSLTIYNMLGQEVKELVSSSQPAGFHQIVWDGTNDSGATVSTGVYFYRLTAGDYRAMKKMFLIK